MKIGVMFGNPETTPGGKALKFYTSVRIDIRRIAQIKKGDEVMGGRHRVKIVKNKVAAPFRTTEFDMLYGEGISKEGEALALGEKLGLVEKSSGGSYSIPSSAEASKGKGEDIKLGRGYDAARTFLKQNKPILNQLLKDIKKGLQEGGMTAKAGPSDDEE
jgi:recombination protein RecA